MEGSEETPYSRASLLAQSWCQVRDQGVERVYLLPQAFYTSSHQGQHAWLAVVTVLFIVLFTCSVHLLLCIRFLELVDSDTWSFFPASQIPFQGSLGTPGANSPSYLLFWYFSSNPTCLCYCWRWCMSSLCLCVDLYDLSLTIYEVLAKRLCLIFHLSVMYVFRIDSKEI